MLQELKADLARYPGGTFQRLSLALRCAGFYPVVVYRIGHDIYVRWPRSLAMLAKVPYKIVAFLTEWATGISIAPDGTIGPGLYIGHWGCTRIGTRVKLGPGVQLLAVSHPLDAAQRALGLEYGEPISIGDDVWIGGGAIVLGGVTIGDRAVVGAGSVVTRDVPADVVVAGNPARTLVRDNVEV